MPCKVFITYASDDRKAARSIGKRLRGQDLPVEIDCEFLEAGREFEKEIRKRIRSCNVLVVIVSRASLKSAWVNFEIGLAKSRTPPMRIIPYLTHKALQSRLPSYLKSYQYVLSPDDLVGSLKKWEPEIGGEKVRDSTSLEPRPDAKTETKILIAGQTCWDRIIWPSGKSRDRIGGSAYYATRAIQHVAAIMHRSVSIDVWAPIGSDLRHKIEPGFESTSINKCFVPQEKTLSFENYYLSKTDWTRRKQKVVQVPDGRICAGNAHADIKGRLSKGSYYQFALLLPLTPHDFPDLAADVVPFLLQSNPGLPIGLELQGLLRDVPAIGGKVGRSLSEVLPKLLRQRAVCCAHANIDEGLFLVRELEKLGKGTRAGCTLNKSQPEKITLRLCEEGIGCVGLTDGGRGSWIAWRRADGKLDSQHSPTPNITKVVKTPHATGAGDTWFGVFAYLMLGLKYDPIIAGLLATQFATIKCERDGALGEEAH